MRGHGKSLAHVRPILLFNDSSSAGKPIIGTMFTGIVETVGVVLGISKSPYGAGHLEVSTPLASELEIGDSVATNGVCLTVAAKTPEAAQFDLLAETALRTNLKDLKAGSLINLERSMPASGRFQGHIVQGHVDVAAAILTIEGIGEDHRIDIALPRDFEQYIVFKGSVAVNGISLTVAEVHESSFVVWIIPHTWKKTNLHSLVPGDRVNLEFDVIAKYLERMLQLEGRTRARRPSSL
jgi:riboflavin synthase